jgi:DNA polymerase-3 subunit gamma/tau
VDRTRTPAPKVARAARSETRAAGQGSAWHDPDWKALTTDLGLPGAVRLLAGNCALLGREGNTVYLRLDPRSESVLTRQRSEALGAALSAHFAEELAVDITVGDTAGQTPLQEQTRLEDERIEAARASLESDPNVQAMKSMFDAELKSDSIELINAPRHD